MNFSICNSTANHFPNLFSFVQFPFSFPHLLCILVTTLIQWLYVICSDLRVTQHFFNKFLFLYLFYSFVVYYHYYYYFVISIQICDRWYHDEQSRHRYLKNAKTMNEEKVEFVYTDFMLFFSIHNSVLCALYA